MIRKRIPERDDRAILQLVRNELLPYTERTMPGVTVDRRILAKRMDGGTTYVYARNGMLPIGFVCCLVRGKTLNIDLLAVDGNVQGKGLGSKLMRAAEGFGIRRGCSNASLFVDQANRGAQRFYEKKGYRMEKFIESFQCFEMTKRLKK